MSNQQSAAPVAAPAPVKPVVLPPGKVETPQVVQLLVGDPRKADEGMSGLEFTTSAMGRWLGPSPQL